MFDFFRFRVAVSLAICLASFGLGTQSASAQFQNLLGQPVGKSGAEPQVTSKIEPGSVASGGEVTLSFTIKLSDPASYLYSMHTQAGGKTQIKREELSGLESLGDWTADHPPKVEFSPDFMKDIEKYTGQVTWSRKFRVTAAKGTASLTGELNYQVCDAMTCRPHKEPLKFAIPVAGTSETATTEAPAPAPLVFEKVAGRGKTRPLTIRAELVPEAENTATLKITAIVAKDWHTYAMAQPEGAEAEPTAFDLEEVVGLEPLDQGFTPDREYETHTEKVPATDNLPARDVVQHIYHDRVTWSQRFRLTAGTAWKDVRVVGVAVMQVCNANGCQPPSPTTFDLDGSKPPVLVAAQGAEKPGAAAPAGAEIPQQPHAGADPRKAGLMSFLLAAFVAGLAALLTPCVFPMVPITVSFFLKQSEKQHHRPFSMALVYCLSIIGTFTILGMVLSFAFGATVITTLANNGWLNIALGLVLLFFGFNLLGMFEIRVPGWLLTYTAGKESAGGYFGVVFMALTFTLTSFTCTFAFLGLILVWSAQGQFWWPLIGLLTFATAFATPFFLLALFPSYLKKLPKSGGWMNRVKVVMGFIELAFVFKFFSVADVAFNRQPWLLDYHLVMSAWMVLSLAAGAYLLGSFRLPHDVPADHTGVVPLMIALSFLGFGGYLAVGLFGSEKPNGWLWENIAAFAPPSFKGGSGDEGPFLISKHDGLKYLLDYDRGVKFASKENLPVFLDFTGVNCANCRKMEVKMALPQNHERLSRLVRIQLFTDILPYVTDKQEAERLLQQNMERQERWFGDVTLPSYVVMTPDGQHVLASFSGNETVEGSFTAFLDKGLEGWEKLRHQQAAQPAAAVR